MKKNIVIVGYPKSGTTWLARLVAELVECPLEGDWGIDDVRAEYREGQNRLSDFMCYKSHHTLDELYDVSQKKIYKVLYIVRDPRDVVISAFHYFTFTYPKLRRFLRFSIVFGPMERLINFFILKKYKKQRMIDMALNGNENINKWCKPSWKDHFKPYKNNNFFFVHYEKLISDPETQCQRILNELNLVKPKDHILKSIINQSFEKKKKEKNSNTKLLRTGRSNNWQNELTTNEKEIFETELRIELLDFDYKIK